jgi:hypothetical protein
MSLLIETINNKIDDWILKVYPQCKGDQTNLGRIELPLVQMSKGEDIAGSGCF